MTSFSDIIHVYVYVSLSPFCYFKIPDTLCTDVATYSSDTSAVLPQLLFHKDRQNLSRFFEVNAIFFARVWSKFHFKTSGFSENIRLRSNSLTFFTSFFHL